MKKIFVILILFVQFKITAQKPDTAGLGFITKHKYLQYLLIPDSNTQASLFYIKYQYLYVPKEFPFRRGGANPTIGINLARFFTKKFILGFCLDSRLFFEGYTRQHFSSAFLNDFDTDFIAPLTNAKDSLQAEVLYKSVHNTEGFRIEGNFPGFYGISFSPFPQKFGGFLLEIKKGGTSYSLYGPYNGKLLSANQENEPMHVETVNNYSFELSFNPYKFFNSKRIILSEQKPKNIFKFIVVSLYYEKFTLKNATFNNLPLNSFVKQEFIDKYSNKNYFGIKIGLGIY